MGAVTLLCSSCLTRHLIGGFSITLLKVLGSVAFGWETTFIFLPQLFLIILDQIYLLCLLGDSLGRFHSFSGHFKVLTNGLIFKY